LPSLIDLTVPLNWFLALSMFTSGWMLDSFFYPTSKHFHDPNVENRRGMPDLIVPIV